MRHGSCAWRRFFRGVVTLVVGACAMACSRETGGPLRVAAAASLREPVSLLATRFADARPGLRVETSFGASSELAAQLRAGAPVDVVLCADEEIPRALEAEGLATSLRPFASNRLVVLASPEVVAQVRQPGDLAGPAVKRIALPAPAVPAGHYAREWLARHGLAEAVGARAVQTENVRAALAAVDDGHADAAIVYATDARVAHSAKLAFEIPDAEQPRIVYVGLVARDSHQRESARDFLDFLVGPAGVGVLREAGFAALPGSAP
jgi:molybdate transport system substrate-binding protein